MSVADVMNIAWNRIADEKQIILYYIGIIDIHCKNMYL